MKHALRLLITLCFAGIAIAQPTGAPTAGAVQKTISTDRITADLKFGTGRTLTIESGATLNYAAGALFAGSASEFKTDLGLVAIASSGSASDLTTGTVPDVRLSANVSLLGSSIDFATEVSNKPTTRAGYGITDAASSASVASRSPARGEAVTWFPDRLVNPSDVLTTPLYAYWDCASLNATVGSANLTLAAGTRIHRSTSNGLGFYFNESTYYQASAVSYDASAAWSLFLRVVPWNSGDIGCLVSYWATNDRSWKLYYDNRAFVLYTSTDGTAYEALTTSAIYSAGFEYAVACGSDGAGQVWLEVNKRERVTAARTVHDVAGIIEIGATAGGADKFIGIVDEMFLSTTALSTWPDELWNQGRGYSATRVLFGNTGLANSYNFGGPRTEPPHVWIAIGQSNIVGAGGTTPVALQPFPLEWPDGRVNYASWIGTSGTNYPLTWGPLVPQRGLGVIPATGDYTLASAVWAFGVGMADRGALNLHVVRYGSGGTSLASDWSASGATWLAAQSWINTRLSEISSETVDGVIWWQGEQDAHSSTDAAAYKANLIAAISRWRTEWNANLQVLIVLPSNAGTYIDTVRQAILEVAQEVNGVTVAADARGCRRVDTAHVTTEALHGIGFALAQAADLGIQY